MGTWHMLEFGVMLLRPLPILSEIRHAFIIVEYLKFHSLATWLPDKTYPKITSEIPEDLTQPDVSDFLREQIICPATMKNVTLKAALDTEPAIYISYIIHNT